MSSGRDLLIGGGSDDGSNPPRVGLFYPINLYEVRALIFNPDLVFRDAGFSSGDEFVRQSTVHNVRQLKEIIEARFLSLLEWVRSGGQLFSVLTFNTPTRFSDGQYSTTVDVFDCPPFSWLKYRYVKGTQIQYSGPEVARDCFRTFLARPFYNATIDAQDLYPLLKVLPTLSGVSSPIGGYVEYGAGRVIFLPLPNLDREARTSEFSFERLWKEWLALPDKLVFERPRLPEWAEHVMSVKEAEAADRVRERGLRISELSLEIESAQRAIHEEQELKRLFTDSGESLELAVRDALAMLGVQSVMPSNRDMDLICNMSGQLAVIEIKGKKKSAELKDGRQLGEWVERLAAAQLPSEEDVRDPLAQSYVEAIATLGIGNEASPEPKGILVVNAFREEAIFDRTEPWFPDNLVGFLRTRRMCGVTTRQIFYIVVASRSDSKIAIDALQSVLNSSGVLEGFNDLTKILSPIPKI